MKRVKHIINYTIWSLLGLYLLLIVAIHIPAVQSFLGRQVADAIGRKLNTEVTVGNVDLGFFNRVIIDDVVIKDQQQQNLLKSNRLTVKIDLLPLLEGKVRISSAQVFGAHINLYRETAESEPNYQFVLEALKKKEKKEKESAINLRINSLIIRNSSLSYNQLDAEQTPHVFNTKHLNFNNISAYISLKDLTPETIDANVKRMAFNEQSGLQVDRLSFRLEGNQQRASLHDFVLEAPHSKILLPKLEATYSIDSLLPTLAFKGELKDAQLTPSDFRALLPQLRYFDQQLTVNSSFSVTPHQQKISRLSIRSSAKELSLDATAQANDSLARLTISHCRLSSNIFPSVRQAFPTLPESLTDLGTVALKGELTRSARNVITAWGELETAIGTLKGRFSIDENKKFEGHLDTGGLFLNRLLNQKDLGQIVMQMDFGGTPDNIQAKGEISKFEYRQYAYRNISIDANYQDKRISGLLAIDDPHIKTNIEGVFDYTRRPVIRMTGYIKDLAPKALNLSSNWGDAVFSAVVDADFTASSLNDAEGSIDIDDFQMVTSQSDESVMYQLDNLHLKSGYDDKQHYVKLNGDVGEAQLVGQFDWNSLPQSFINYVRVKLPTLPGLPSKTVATSNNFELHLRLTDTEWLQKLFNIPISFNQNLRLNAVVDDPNNNIYVKGSLPAFTIDGDSYADGDILLKTVGDTSYVDIGFTKILAQDKQLSIGINAKAGNNTISSSISADNHNLTTGQSAFYGQFNSNTQLYTNEQGKSEAHITILPSNVNIKGAEWTMEPSDILYSDNRLAVDHFNLHYDDQHLIINGTASDQPDDSLVADLHDIDVDYLLDLVNFRSVRFGGLASGQVLATEAFGDFKAWADLTVNQFTFQDADMGTLEADARWDGDEERINLSAAIHSDDEDHTLVDGYISLQEKALDLQIKAQGTPIAFCHSFTKAFLSQIDGKAHGAVELAGALKRLYLTGDLAVDGQATLSALNTTYTMRGDSVRFRPDAILLDGFHIYDRNSHVATLAGGLRHQSFKHITFDVDVDADNFLSYDFPDFDNSSICGTVYATGTANIHGRPGETIINCDVTSDRNSIFSYNASNPDAISNQQFITWREKVNAGETPIFLGGEEAQNTIAPDLRINFRINATPDATLKVLMDPNTGDNISLQGNGVINASYYNKGPFQMFGTYNTERGTYSMTIQNIIKKNFTFQDGGTIIFGGNPFNAALNLKASYTVNGVSLSDLNIGNSFSNTVRVNCLMNILGTAGAPRVEFDLEMPTVNAEEQQMIRSVIASEQELNQQVVYLLGIGRFYTQEANNASTQQYGQTELAMQSFLSGTVSTQINELLSQVIKNDDWNFGANISTGNEGWHNAEYEGIVSGSMLNNRLLINGQFGYRDNATQATPSFIGDFDISYLLTPSGNIALKVYNQTNDRYFTRSSLNTQGVGLIMKKDFNGFSDLFHSRKKKKR